MTDWQSVTRHDSCNPNVCKYVFTQDNAVAEAVLYKYPTYKERTVVCCSTQSGCPVGCRFCGTGEFFARSLTEDEIVSQVEHLFSDKDIVPESVDKLQIMFMSMGEPMLNWKALRGAMIRLGKLYPQSRLLISNRVPMLIMIRSSSLLRKTALLGFNSPFTSRRTKLEISLFRSKRS